MGSERTFRKPKHLPSSSLIHRDRVHHPERVDCTSGMLSSLSCSIAAISFDMGVTRAMKEQEYEILFATCYFMTLLGKGGGGIGVHP